jgi:class I fructose-bisphosphate aldolase
MLSICNTPKSNPEKDVAAPKPYNTLQPSRVEAARMVVESAGKTLVLFSGGEMLGEGDVIDKARFAMEAGATGLTFGRNVWQRPYEEALTLSRTIHDLLQQFGA